VRENALCPLLKGESQLSRALNRWSCLSSYSVVFIARGKEIKKTGRLSLSI
jgi:hypothetical protein